MLCLVLVAGIQQNRIRCFIGFEEQFEEQKEGTIEGKKTSEQLFSIVQHCFFPTRKKEEGYRDQFFEIFFEEE